MLFRSLAEKPNQVWSWDITKLMGPTKWSYFYLYVILDIYSRRGVRFNIVRSNIDDSNHGPIDSAPRDCHT